MMGTIQAKKPFYLDNRPLADGERVPHRRSESRGITWWWECRCGSNDRVLRLVRPADATHAYADLSDSLPKPVCLTDDGPWWQCAECRSWYNAR
jgi:hypothetical protein